MVRFIIQFIVWFNNKCDAIYIPIWLDLLSGLIKELSKINVYLHSNMVRFIIPPPSAFLCKAILFTFQYG